MIECFLFDDIGGFVFEELGGGCDVGWFRFWYWYICDGVNGFYSGYWWVSMYLLVIV